MFKIAVHSGQTVYDALTTSTTTTLVLALSIYLAISTFKSWSRLSAFPGPFLFSISYASMFWTRLSGVAHLRYQALSRQYGPLVRIGPNDLLCADPEHLRRMSSVRSSYGRSSWYKATRLDPYHDMMGSTLDKTAHMSLRAKMAPGYNGTDCPDLEDNIRSQVQALIGLIRREYLTESCGTAIPVDFGRLADFYAHDARSVTSFGKPLGLMEHNKDVYGIIAIVKIALNIIQVFTDIPPLQRIFLSRTALKLFGPKPSDTYGVGRLLGMAREHVAARFSPEAEEQNDLLGSFLRHGLDRRSAESEVMFPIIAGSDTTANAIKMTVSHLAADPQVSSRLQQEIQEATRDGRLNQSEPFTSEQAAQLPYLQAVIWEGLRINPPFGGLIMKEVGPEGDTVNGIHIPAGTRIGHSTWAITHSPSVYGSDADCFRPERWLEADEKSKVLMQKHAEFVFGTGRWGCPGRRVALKELSILLVELFRRFDFGIMDGEPGTDKEKSERFRSGLALLVIRERVSDDLQ